MTPTRPAIRYMGGKWKLAPRIIAHFPPHRVYVEPFGGGGSVLLRKARVHAEVWNDLDAEVVNLFRVLRDDAQAGRLVMQLELTPFAREEQLAAYPIAEDPVERARRFIVLAYQGFGNNAHARRPTGFRANSTRSGTVPSMDWRNYPDGLVKVIERWRGVIVENRDAKAVMAAHDGPTTLHYVDPPYVHATRGQGNPRDVLYRGYSHELSDDDHRALLAFLRTLEGFVVLSGYAHPIYDEALADWGRVELPALADGARPRIEVLWLNPRTVEALAAEAAGAARAQAEATRQGDWIGWGRGA
jgi:DNA adenine methylase